MNARTERTAKDYALMYIGVGWQIFPVWNAVDGRCACISETNPTCDRPGKHPIADLAPAGFNDATSDAATIERWWTRHPEANIGIRTGRESGITVIDADASGGKPGVVNLDLLCNRNGGVPETYQVNTGGGGIHVYFKFSPALATGTNVLAEAIDCRSDGGYVIAPPSSHISGGTYTIRKQAELLDLPEWMRPAAPTRGRGRPRTRAAMRMEKVESLLRHVDPDDRDDWLNVGLIMGRMYVGTPAENEAWAMYEAWSARSQKFDEHRGENLERMREAFNVRSQEAPRQGQEALGPGTLIQLARDGGWTPFGDRVAVPYEPGNEALMCSQLVAVLVGREDNTIFEVQGEVVDVLRARIPVARIQQYAKARGLPPPEGVIVRRTASATVLSELSKVAVLAAVNKNGEPVAHPVKEGMAAMILKNHSFQFPTLTGIGTFPMVAPNGDLIMRPRGYDEETGFYFNIDPGVRVDDMSAEAGWAWLQGELLADFPFEEPADQAIALGMLLAFMQRQMMKTCPGFAVVAPQAGTGKSTLIELASLAVHGEVIAPHPLPDDEDELRKAIHSLLIAKLLAVLFDNISKGSVNTSDQLAKLLTAEVAADRTLGASETRKQVNSLLVTFTGNNIVFGGDLTSRVLTIRLNAKAENPLRRTFRHQDVKQWVLGERNKALSSLVAVARAGIGFVFPAGTASSRFEDFDQLIAKPVMAVTGIDLRECMSDNTEVETDEDADKRAALKVIHQWQNEWRAEENKQPWRTRDLALAVELNGMPEAAKKALAGASSSKAWEQSPAEALGKFLRAVRGSYLFKPLVLETRKPDAHVKAARWFVKVQP